MARIGDRESPISLSTQPVSDFEANSCELASISGLFGCHKINPSLFVCNYSKASTRGQGWSELTIDSQSVIICTSSSKAAPGDCRRAAVAIEKDMLSLAK